MLIPLIGLLAAGTGFSQKPKTIELYLGLSQGIAMSSVGFNPNEKTHLLPGYYGGLNIVYKSQPIVGVKLEVNYVQKGWESVLDSSQSYSRTLNYIEIPFTTHIMLSKRNSRFLIDIGPYVGYLRSESEKINISGAVRDYFGHQLDRKLDFGYCLAFTYQYKTPLGRFGIEARYSNSLTNLFIPSDEFIYYSTKNQVLSARIAYTVNIISRQTKN